MVVFANRRARNRFGIREGAVPGAVCFASLWSDDKADIVAALRRIGGSSNWLPFALTPCTGEANERMPLKGRALMTRSPGAGPVLHLMIMSDEARIHSFDHHRTLLARLNAELAKGQRAEAVLKRMYETQRSLNRELVHRVKNNLALLGSMLRMTRRQSTDGGVDAALGEFERRLMSLAAVHEILDRNDETDFVRADQMIGRICAELETSLAPESVVVRCSLAKLRLHVTDATALALIVNELVTNALKHAFPDGAGGEVVVALESLEDGRVVATIRDDGVGIPRGAALVRGSGSRIVDGLAHQLKADMVVSGRSGTRCRLVFRPGITNDEDASGAHAERAAIGSEENTAARFAR